MAKVVGNVLALELFWLCWCEKIKVTEVDLILLVITSKYPSPQTKVLPQEQRLRKTQVCIYNLWAITNKISIFTQTKHLQIMR